MSVDKTIQDMSTTLEHLGTLVAHLNGKINSVTGRLNLTLDNFDQSIAAIAKDANDMTSKVGTTVSQAPDAWVYLTIAIVLILVFILLAIFLLFQVILKAHVVYLTVKSKPGDSSPPAHGSGTGATYFAQDRLKDNGRRRKKEKEPLLPRFRSRNDDYLMGAPDSNGYTTVPQTVVHPPTSPTGTDSSGRGTETGETHNNGYTQIRKPKGRSNLIGQEASV